MPITEREWNEGEFDPNQAPPQTEPVGEYENDKDLILAFLSENGDRAYTEPEIHRGVDFGKTDDPETVYEILSLLPNTILDVVGEAAATGLVSDNIEKALADLVGEGTIERHDLERDGETVPYYRLKQV